MILVDMDVFARIARRAHAKKRRDDPYGLSRNARALYDLIRANPGISRGTLRRMSGFKPISFGVILSALPGVRTDWQYMTYEQRAALKTRDDIRLWTDDPYDQMAQLAVESGK